ncbi:peptidyl-prolyl cis-trans isomerase [Planosporangium mesophilum]|uniref:Peptidyl-prolyl cis-trans isomerase n=2 Tax=Planosporangium mesophilum TaxID=689768 RepID=A0A8J3X1F6_9ACTN|nr:peptidyl-prolyl cis-trans isomerase [Planosporangium mesophilum]
MTSNRDRQQRAAARARLEREMTLRAESAQRRRRLQAMIGAGLAVVVVLVGVVLLVTLTGSDKKTNNTAASASSSPTSCKWNSAVDPSAPTQALPAGVKDVGTPPASGEPRSGTQTMTINTNLGVVKIEMDLAKAPCTAASFAHLASKHFLDNSSCHRLVAGISALQCGDPGGQGTGGPTYRFANENLPTDRRPAYPKGSVAMANSGPDTNGSQFFFLFNDVDSQRLSPDYSLWGKVVEGMDIIEKVAAGGDDGAYEPQPGGGRPKTEFKFLSVTVGAPNKG